MNSDRSQEVHIPRNELKQVYRKIFGSEIKASIPQKLAKQVLVPKRSHFPVAGSLLTYACGWISKSMLTSRLLQFLFTSNHYTSQSPGTSVLVLFTSSGFPPPIPYSPRPGPAQELPSFPATSSSL